MTKDHAVQDPTLFDAQMSASLVALLNQTLADALDLAYQTKQAHWNVKGFNFYGLHLLFDDLHAQLVIFIDQLAERVVAIGGQAMGTIRIAGKTSHLEEYPLDAHDSKAHVNALVDRFGDFGSRVRSDIAKAEKLGDKDTADLYTNVSRATDKALWLLTAHQEA